MAIDVWNSTYMVCDMTFRHICRPRTIHIFGRPDAEVYVTVELYN